MFDELRKALKDWYKVHQRDLPWRHTNHPYAIWLSEIILQQTRVDQGLPYFNKFIERFPSINDLANASEQEVLNLWQGLGYYSRGRNLHTTAKCIVDNHHGKFPTTYKELIQLKGIGPYTAAAIASFAYNLPHAVVDGNVYRVLSRYFGIELAINSSEGERLFKTLAQDLLDEAQPALHNQAIMEFGALQCKPVSPNCNCCPVVATCVAFREDKIPALPHKLKKIKTKQRFFVYHLVRNDKNQLAFTKRKPKDIWEGLFEFPLLEFESEAEQVKFLKSKVQVGAAFKHILTHQKIKAYFVIDSLPVGVDAEVMYLDLADLEQHPIPRLIDKFLNAHQHQIFSVGQ